MQQLLNRYSRLFLLLIGAALLHTGCGAQGDGGNNPTNAGREVASKKLRQQLVTTLEEARDKITPDTYDTETAKSEIEAASTKRDGEENKKAYRNRLLSSYTALQAATNILKKPNHDAHTSQEAELFRAARELSLAIQDLADDCHEIIIDPEQLTRLYPKNLDGPTLVFAHSILEELRNFLDKTAQAIGTEDAEERRSTILALTQKAKVHEQSLAPLKIMLIIMKKE